MWGEWLLQFQMLKVGNELSCFLNSVVSLSLSLLYLLMLANVFETSIISYIALYSCWQPMCSTLTASSLTPNDTSRSQTSGFHRMKSLRHIIHTQISEWPVPEVVDEVLFSHSKIISLILNYLRGSPRIRTRRHLSFEALLYHTYTRCWNRFMVLRIYGLFFNFFIEPQKHMYRASIYVRLTSYVTFSTAFSCVPALLCT